MIELKEKKDCLLKLNESYNKMQKKYGAKNLDAKCKISSSDSIKFPGLVGISIKRLKTVLLQGIIPILYFPVLVSKRRMA